MDSQNDGKMKNNNYRRIYRVIDHAIDHIKNGTLDVATSLLQTEMDRDRQYRRRETSLFKPRTLFAFMFYGTFCYLILRGLKVPPELNTIVSSLSGYFYGVSKGKIGGDKRGKDN